MVLLMKCRADAGYPFGNVDSGWLKIESFGLILQNRMRRGGKVVSEMGGHCVSDEDVDD